MGGFWDLVKDVFRVILALLISKATEKQPGAVPSEKPEYTVRYAQDYIRKHYSPMNDNVWRPQYGRSLNYLYDNEREPYERRKRYHI